MDREAWAVAWSPDGRWLWTGGSKGLRRWPTNEAALTALATARSRPDSPEEDSQFHQLLRDRVEIR